MAELRKIRWGLFTAIFLSISFSSIAILSNSYLLRGHFIWYTAPQPKIDQQQKILTFRIAWYHQNSEIHYESLNMILQSVMYQIVSQNRTRLLLILQYYVTAIYLTALQLKKKGIKSGCCIQVNVHITRFVLLPNGQNILIWVRLIWSNQISLCRYMAE